eukprot:SM007934S22551  [mRNA]  locus=s7934:73:666:- [translate_table: standard]
MATRVEPPDGTCPPGKHQFMLWRTLFEVDVKYTPIKPIGKGAYGVVCSARNADTGEKVAIKKIANAFENATDARRTLREIRLLRHLYHENIIAVKDIMRPPQRHSFSDVYLVYELMDTDLHQIIRSSQPLTDDHYQYFIYQVGARQLPQRRCSRHLRSCLPCLAVVAFCLHFAEFAIARFPSDLALESKFLSESESG